MSDDARALRRRERTRARVRALRDRRREAGAQLSLFDRLDGDANVKDLAPAAPCAKNSVTCGNRVTGKALPVEIPDRDTLYCARPRAGGSVATGSTDHPPFIPDRENQKEGTPADSSVTPDVGEAFVRSIVSAATTRLRPWSKYLGRSDAETRERMLYEVDRELKAANLKMTQATIERVVDRELKAGTRGASN